MWGFREKEEPLKSWKAKGMEWGRREVGGWIFERKKILLMVGKIWTCLGGLFVLMQCIYH